MKCSCNDCIKNGKQKEPEKKYQNLSGNNIKGGKHETVKGNGKSDSTKKQRNSESSKGVIRKKNNLEDPGDRSKAFVTSTSMCHSCQDSESGENQRIREDHSQDCGYSSEQNNGSCDTRSASSSVNSSPEGSEVACSEGFCDHEGNLSSISFHFMLRFQDLSCGNTIYFFYDSNGT